MKTERAEIIECNIDRRNYQEFSIVMPENELEIGVMEHELLNKVHQLAENFDTCYECDTDDLEDNGLYFGEDEDHQRQFLIVVGVRKYSNDILLYINNRDTREWFTVDDFVTYHILKWID